MDDDQQFCLRWNNHQSTLISVFDTLLEKGIHVDCTLAAEGQTLKAHKVVLSACSPYFESVLSQQYDKHPIIILKDVKFAELRAMMDYMYRGEVNISQDQLGALLKAAESLQIKGLSDNKPPPPPPPPQNNTPAAVSPAIKVSGARTLSPGHEEGSREGSASPTRRKRKKRRASLSPVSTPTPLLLNNNPPTPPDTHHDTMAKIKLLQPSEDSLPTPIKPLLPSSSPDTVATLEPKSEVPDDGQDEPVEDLTLDEEAYSEAEHNGAGTSHSLPDVSTQGYSWHMDRSQDDISLSHEGQRDSTGVQSALEMEQVTVLSLLQEPLRPGQMMDRVPQEGVPAISAILLDKNTLEENLLQNNNFITKGEHGPNIFPKYESEAEMDDFDDILLPDESEVFGNSGMNCSEEEEKFQPSRGRGGGDEPPRQFECRHCGKRYRWKSTLRRHESVECGGKPPAHACPYCVYRAKQRGNLGVHIRKHHNAQWNIFANTKLRKTKKINV